MQINNPQNKGLSCRIGCGQYAKDGVVSCLSSILSSSLFHNAPAAVIKAILESDDGTVLIHVRNAALGLRYFFKCRTPGGYR